MSDDPPKLEEYEEKPAPQQDASEPDLNKVKGWFGSGAIANPAGYLADLLDGMIDSKTPIEESTPADNKCEPDISGLPDYDCVKQESASPKR